MKELTIMDGIIIFSYSIVCICLFIASGFLFFKSRGKSKKVRNYLLAIALFFLLFGISRTTMFIFELTFPEDFVWNISVHDFDSIFQKNPEIAVRHDIVWRFTTGIGAFGVAILMFVLERQILEKKTKYVLTIITLITVIPALILGVEGKDEVGFVRIVLYIGNFLMVAIPLIYLYLGIKTSGDTRMRALGAMTGMIILFTGIVFNSSFGKTQLEGLYGIPGLQITYILYGLCTAIGIFVYLKSIQY